MNEKMFITGPWITQKEIDYVTDAITNGWYKKQNSFIERFEEAFRDYTDMDYAIALPSCVSGIHLSLIALGVGPGDEVIIPEFARARNIAPVLHVGATPVFADIDPQTWCLSADSFKKNITNKTKAILMVDLYGNLPNWDDFLNLSDRRDIVIIEDASEAIASEYKGRLAGTFGTTGVFSFHNSRTLTTGEGGMLLTNEQEVYEKIGEYTKSESFTNELNPVYYTKISDLQAALGLAQLERIADLAARKQDIFYWYENELDGLEGITLNYEAPGTKNTYWMTSLIIDPSLGVQRDDVRQELQKHNIETTAFYPPLSSLPEFQKLKQAKRAKTENPISYQLSPYGFNLPSAMNMTEELVKQICNILKEILYK